MRDQREGASSARWLHQGLRLVVVAIVLTWILLPGLRSASFGVISGEDETAGIRVLDFAVILEMVRATWESGPSAAHAVDPERLSAYDPERQLDVASRWLGRPAPGSLLFLHTPTILWVFGPLALLANRAAYVAWTFVGLAAVWWMTAPRRGPLVLGPLLMLSPPVLACFALGQTAIVTAALLLFLAAGDDRRNGEAGGRMPEALALWALSLKPQLALAAGVAMLATGRLRAVALAMGLTLASTLALLPWLGAGWVGDYLSLLGSVNLEQVHPAFAGTLDVSQMGNLRAVLNAQLGAGDALASRVSTAVMITALFSLWVCGRVFRPPRPRVWSSAVLILLCFAPHVNAYQQLQLYVALALCWREPAPARDPRRLAMAALAFGALFLASPLGPLGRPAPLVGFTANLLFGVLVWIRRPSGAPLRGGPAHQLAVPAPDELPRPVARGRLAETRASHPVARSTSSSSRNAR